MTAAWAVLWLAGFALLLLWLVRAVARARVEPERIVGRWEVAAAIAAVAALGFTGAHVWGVDIARNGMARIQASTGAGAGVDGVDDARSAATPPRARLFLRHVQLILGRADERAPDVGDVAADARSPASPQRAAAREPRWRALVGYSPEAVLHLPRGYGLGEARRGWDLLAVEASGPQGLRVAAVANPEPTGTRVVLAARPRAGVGSPSPDEVAHTARDALGPGARCRVRQPDSEEPAGNADGDAASAGDGAGDHGSAELTGPGAIFAILCTGERPRVALVLERELVADAPDSLTPVRVIPLVWRGNRWRPHHVQIASGSLMQIGTTADALPGIPLWEVPAPAGRAELFFPPSNLLASCDEWLSGQPSGTQGFFSGTPADAHPLPVGHPAAPGDRGDHGDHSICVLPFTPPFGLEVRRLLPELSGIGARSLWAAGLLITPALLALLLLLAQARSSITAARMARLLALGWLSAVLAALGVFRLLWAHRIDMLRDYEAVGARVLANQVLLALVAGALAATCALSFGRAGAGRSRGWRAGLRAVGGAVLAWAVCVAIGGFALHGDVEPGWLTRRQIGQIALSLALGTAPFWLPRVRGLLVPVPAPWLVRVLDRLRVPAPARLFAIAIAALLVCALVTAVASAAWPRTVTLKLGLAWAATLLVYAALRASIVDVSGLSLARIGIALAATMLALAALARLDPGVAVAIAGPGVLAALLLASHDARLSDSSLRQLASYRRHHAPLVVAHCAALGLLGLVVAVGGARSLAASAAGEPDALLARSLTLGAIHLVLFAAALFVPAAAIAYYRRGLRAAAPWLAIGAVLAGVWLARGPLVDRVLGSSTQAANRMAIVLDPGYALLRSESNFLAGITAWRETIAPPGDSADNPLTPDTAAPAEVGDVGAHAADAVDAPLAHGQGYFGAQLLDPGVLLSVENDYFPVLLLRETGVLGVVLVTVLLLLLVTGAWVVSATRFRHAGAPQRTRALAAIVLGGLCLYQPLASLGALPLTGISWPGLGIDSPSDFWLLVGLMLWVFAWGGRRVAAARVAGSRAETVSRAENEAKLDAFDAELRASRLFRRTRAAAVAAAALLAIAGLLLIARASAFAMHRPNPVGADGRAVAPFDGLEDAVEYAYHLQCPWREQHGETAEALVPDDVLGTADAPGVQRFHGELREAWRRHRGQGVREMARFLAGDPGACGARGIAHAGPWRFERSPERPSECRMVFKYGWPEVELEIRRAAVEPDDEIDDGEADDAPDDKVAAEPEEDADGEPDGDAADGDADVDAARGAAIRHSARCEIDARADVLRQLQFPARKPYRNARVRLVSRAMGAAARDRGELLSGQVLVRLRAGAGAVDLTGAGAAAGAGGSAARAGFHIADTVRISDELSIAITGALGGDQVVVRREQPPSAPSPSEPRTNLLFVREPPSDAVQVLEVNDDSWQLVTPGADEIPLSRTALVVVEGPTARGLWLFRPPRRWTAGPTAPEADIAGSAAVSVDPLIADDISTVRGERRRHYPFGGLLPEVGWVNPYHARMSLGLDGWVRVALLEYEARLAGRATWIDGERERDYCGTLDAASAVSGSRTAASPSSPSASDSGDEPASALSHVCSASPLDGVLECRIALQPELAIRLRHLTELLALSPDELIGGDAEHPARASYALLRGDTGEILAQGEFVPGRASSAYAPSTPEIEQYLIRLREDRDPMTGRKLPRGARGESSAEKIEWAQPIAIGSTMKPLLARALERADPAFAGSLVLQGAPVAAARCPRSKVHAILGHCPPTESLWNLPGTVDMERFLSQSVNWYQAAIGLLGTAAPVERAAGTPAGSRRARAGTGRWGFGREDDGATATEPGTTGGETAASRVLARNVGDHRPDRDSALWTEYRRQRVVSANRTVHLTRLRQTPMWEQFEALIGRPLCTAGNKRTCRRRAARADLCAARALPIERPTRDLRHLVAIGPDSFDFYPELADPTRTIGPAINTREYLQFLRGSGLHPWGSLLQLTDAFNRLVFEHGERGRPGRDARGGRYELAASWFPVATRGHVPDWSCAAAVDGNTVRAGLCGVVRRGGTAAALGERLFADDRLIVYGVKTGTIDSLADVAENPDACEHYRTGHTVPGRPADAKSQPYWLPCAKRGDRAQASVNDSLLVVSFGVRTDGGVVPLTLGLRFQRGGLGFAARAMGYYADVIAAYFAPPAPASTPPRSPAPSSP